MKIIVIGTRGIPNIPGGVETHCEKLYSSMSSKQHLDITIACRSPYMKENAIMHNGIRLKTLYSPKSKVFEALVHSVIAASYCIVKRPDIVHVHAVGPNLVAPLLRCFGLKVVMTHHGPDYERKKWKKVPKMILKMGEWSGVKFANKVIVISNQINSSLINKYGRNDCIVIPNGVSRPLISASYNFLKQNNLVKNQYILALGRFVPEKGFDYLIKAFKKSSLCGCVKLVIAGGADHETPYSLGLQKLALKEGVILTGFIKGEPLTEIFKNAGLYIIPSFYEGLPITLLEAMSHGLNILASDIPANKEVNLDADSYFETGNIDKLATSITEKWNSREVIKKYNMLPYNWDNIASSTMSVYDSMIKKTDSLIKKDDLRAKKPALNLSAVVN